MSIYFKEYHLAFANSHFCCLLFQDSLSDFSSRNSDLSLGSTDSPNKLNPKRKKTLKTTNAYFYWVTREQGSFDWFKGVMNEVADQDQRVLTNVMPLNLTVVDHVFVCC